MAALFQHLMPRYAKVMRIHVDMSAHNCEERNGHPFFWVPEIHRYVDIDRLTQTRNGWYLVINEQEVR